MSSTELTSLLRIERNVELGRYAVVSKAVCSGTVVLEELPFVVGPKPNSPTVCLECCAPVDGTANGTRCQHCQWPLCDDCKLNSARTNHKLECAEFVKNKVKFQNLPTSNQICLQLDCITPLRLLLQKDANPERWENEVSKMVHHRDDRVQSDVWKADNVNVVGYLRGPCKLKERFSDELIQQACGILEINAFEGKSAGGHKLRCIYPKMALLAHSCVPNTTHSILPREDYKLVVRASVNVKENEMLYTTYTFTTNETRTRQEHLKKGKNFTCKCARCLDPTELNTHFSSLICKNCSGGFIISTNPLNNDAEWHCTKCSFKTPGSAIQTVVNTIESEITQLQELETSIENIKSCEGVLQKYSRILHPNHYLMISMKENLIDMYGWQLSNKIDNEFIAAECLERKITLCRDVLKILDVIQPGLNRARAMVMYEIFTSMGAVLKKNWNSLPNRSEHVEEARKLLGDIIKVFEWEDESSLEQYLADMCRKISDDLRASEQFTLDENDDDN